MAFLDFGFFKTLTTEEVDQLMASTKATYEHDAEALFRVIAPLGHLPDDPALAQPFYESYWSIFGWLLTDHVVTVDGAATGAMMRSYTKLRKAEEFKRLMLPAEHFVLMRAVMLLIGLLGQLRATGNWLDVAREWLLSEPPATSSVAWRPSSSPGGPTPVADGGCPRRMRRGPAGHMCPAVGPAHAPVRGGAHARPRTTPTSSFRRTDRR